MIKKIGKKDKFKPYVCNNETCIISWGYQDLQEKGFGEWYSEQFKTIPDLSTIKKTVLDWYNSEIDKDILSGMTWKGYSVWLSTENQFNYKAAFDIAIQTNGENLPIVFKLGTTDNPVYYEFKEIDELKDFYFKSHAFIQDTLMKGWKKKDAIDWGVYKNN